MIHKDYDGEGLGAKMNFGSDPQGAWRQGEMIGGEPKVVK
jgi:hypothetical protein